MRQLRTILMLALLTLQSGGLFGQEYRILPREQLDSVANPVAAADSPMRFECTRIDVGTIGEEDAPSEYRYRWRNAGEEPVVITAVQTGCGCAVARYDKRPVNPGETATIAVVFHPKGHPGWFSRKIAVYTQQARRPQAVLELTGRVEPAQMPVHAYRYAFGPLRLKQTQVRLDAARRGAERIEVLNAGDRALRIAADTAVLPRYLRVVCDPEVIPPGAKADIEIGFDPAEVEAELPEQIPVLLNGIALPPEQRTVTVRFGEEDGGAAGPTNVER